MHVRDHPDAASTARVARSAVGSKNDSHREKSPDRKNAARTRLNQDASLDSFLEGTLEGGAENILLYLSLFFEVPGDRSPATAASMSSAQQGVRGI